METDLEVTVGYSLEWLGFRLVESVTVVKGIPHGQCIRLG